MSKNVAAINITSREQFGESQYLSKYSNQLVELMQPVALQANKDLYSYEYQAIANQAQAMLKSGELNSVQEAQAYVNDAFQMYLNPYQAMSSGNTMQKWTSINTYAQGGIDSPSAWLQNLVGNTRTAYSWAGGDTLTGSIIQNALGGRNYRYINTNNSNKTEDILDDIVIKNNEDLAKEFAKQIGLADNYNTNTDKVNKAILNATADIGDIKSIITDKGWAIGEVIVGGITAWLGAKLIGGAIGKMAGSLLGNGSSGGLMSLLGGAGTAVGGVAIGVLSAAAIMGIASAVSDANLKKANSKANKELYDTSSELYGNSVATEILGSSYTSEGAIDWENGNWFGNGLKTFGGALAEGGRWIGSWFTGTEGDNSGYYKNFRDALNMSDNSMDEEYRKAITLAWLLLADYGNGSSRLGDVNMTHEDLVQYLKSSESPSVYKAMSYFGKAPLYGWRPKDSGGNRVDNISSTYLNKLKEEVGENFHRYGLDEVPYDNYVASLHEGEAILTASTANELRSLLDEYRNNNQASANIEAVVQQQTNDLCSKLDEVVVAIARLNVGGSTPTASSIDQLKAQNLLKNSMLHMKSTKNALN